MRYILLEAGSHDTLSTKVERHLKDGFELYGNPFMGKFGFYYQAVIKRLA